MALLNSCGNIRHQGKKNLIQANNRSVTKEGICKYNNDLNNIFPISPGPFVDLETGEVIGHHQGVQHWTIGQRIRLGNEGTNGTMPRNKNTHNIERM